MIRVWDHSEHTGTTLLTLLALADWANDSGLILFKYGNDKIAQRIRGSDSKVKRHLRLLRQSGELYAPPLPGRKRVAKFVTSGLSVGEIAAVLADHYEMLPFTAATTAK